MRNIRNAFRATNHSNSPTIPVGDHLNREGAPSYYRPLKEQVVQILTTGTLGDTFYVSGRKLATEAYVVFARAIEECPEFLTRAIVYARVQGMMKTLPILGLAVLSGARGHRTLFETAFPRVILTPDDARDFAMLVKSGSIPGKRGLGGSSAKAMRAWLEGVSEYHAVKYGSANSREITLRDLIRLTHPRPLTPTAAERFGWLVRGVDGLGDSPDLNPQIRAFEALKRATTESEALTLIRQGRLPYEVVVPALKATTPAIWAELLRQAPYMNLLRNLATFTRHGVFADEANVRYAVQKLTDRRAVEHSRVLPFRFFSAWQRYCSVDGFDTRIADALRYALEISFSNMPSLGNHRVAIGTDVSGSMTLPISEKSSTRFIDIAGVFTGALLKRIEGRVIPLPFEFKVHSGHELSSRDDIMVTAEKISSIGGGGTAVGAPVEYLLDRKIVVDVFIGITDNEDWCYGHGRGCSGSFLELWSKYQAKVAPNARAYLVTIAPYRDAVAPDGSKGVRFIYGWSDSVPNYIARDLESGASQISEIEQMSLEPLADPKGIAPETACEDAQTEDS